MTEPTTLPEPPDRALVAVVYLDGMNVPHLYERDDNGGHAPGAADRWYDQSLDAYSWADIASAASEERKVVRLFREDDPTVALIPLPAGQPDVTIAATAFSVSPLPVDNPDRRHCQMLLEPRPGNRAVVVSGAGEYVDADGNWSLGAVDSDEWRAAHWHTWERAVALAAEAAKGMERALRPVQRLVAGAQEAER